jgi:hypothetical protein
MASLTVTSLISLYTTAFLTAEIAETAEKNLNALFGFQRGEQPMHRMGNG